MSNTNQESQEYIIIDIPTMDGTDKEGAILERFQFNNKDYMVIGEVEGDMILDNFYLYEYKEDGDDLEIFSIDDEEEFNSVVEAYYKICEADIEE